MRAIRLLVLWITLSGCRHVDLLDTPPDQAALDAGLSWHKNKENRRLSCDGILEFQGTDTWSSRFLRWFTPLPGNKSSFLLHEDGPNSSVTIPGEAPFFLKDSKLSGWDRIYVESLRLYLRMPLAIPKAYNPVFLGEKTLGPETYKAMFFNLRPGLWNDPSLNQFIAYYSQGSNRLTFVQFTYRDLSASYVGWMNFGADKNFAAFPYPSRISIGDAWDTTEPAHIIEIEAIACIPPDVKQPAADR